MLKKVNDFIPVVLDRSVEGDGFFEAIFRLFKPDELTTRLLDRGYSCD